MTSETLLALDQGTSSSRAILFSRAGDALATSQKDLSLQYPRKGWVEQDADAIWTDTRDAARQVLKQGNPVAVGIANQRETTILWDRKSGVPIYNAIVWQDRRTAPLCRELIEAGHETLISERTGLLIDPYFSATKIRWIIDNVDGARERAEKGELAFGTVETWLLWNLTGGRVHATDVTNASRTLLMNIHDLRWDAELLALFNIPSVLLPEIRDNVADFGSTADGVFDRPLPITGMAGDQQAAMIGQACFKPGMTKSTYGTGCFALTNIGPDFKSSRHRLLTTIAYKIGEEKAYALEGSIFVAGAAIQWLRDNVGFFDDAADSETLARSVPDSNGVYFVPAFTGLGAPHWRPDARAAIMGLTRESTSAHITRAALEAQAYQTLDLMDAIAGDGGQRPDCIRIDGGLTMNDLFCQFLSDMLHCRVEVPKTTETTALGAAFLAGVGAGVYDGTDGIAEIWQCQRHFEPAMEPHHRDAFYSGWKDCVARLID